MELDQHLKEVRDSLRRGEFVNEAAVKQGVVLRLLHALEWPTYDPKTVWPEYTVGTKRADYALCPPPVGKPLVFIEVKAVGQSEGAERQLFEYAFERGVSIAILTDGQEWNFFLPAEQGSMHERRVYRLDLIGREIQECADRLTKYLAYGAVCCGTALQTLRNEYQDVARKRAIEDTLPKAWQKLIEEQDSLLLDLLADKVETLCVFKPDLEAVGQFLSNLPTALGAVIQESPSAKHVVRSTSGVKASMRSTQFGYTLRGRVVVASSAIDVERRLLDDLAAADPEFMNRFAARKHGRSRRYVAQDRSDLYRGRRDLCEECSEKLACGWWMGTNYSRSNIRQIIELAAEVAGLRVGRDLVLNLG